MKGIASDRKRAIECDPTWAPWIASTLLRVEARAAYLLLAHNAHISGTILALGRGEKAECARYNCVGEGSRAYGALNFQWLEYFYTIAEGAAGFCCSWKRGGICWLTRVTGYLRGRYLPRNFRFEYIVSDSSKLSTLTGFYTGNKIVTWD